VPDRDGLLFIAVLGIGLVAIAVDMLTVVLRRPALAGLPMLAIYSVPVAVYVDSVPVLPFIIGAIGYLWLLTADNIDKVRRFGRRFTGDGRDVDVWEPSPLAAAGRRLAVIGVAAAVLLPLAVPGITTGLLSRLTQAGSGVAGQGGNGGGSRVSLFATLSGQLRETATTELVKVTTNEPDPFYLRIGVADVVNAQGFSSRTPSGRAIARGLPDPRNIVDTDSASYTEYRATIKATGLNQSNAPVYSTTIGVDKLDNNWFYDSTQLAVYSPRATTKGREYSIDYLRAKFAPEELRNARPLAADDPIKTTYTQVPKDPYVDSLVGRLIRGDQNDYDKVRSLYNYFSKDNNFAYSLQTATGTSGTEIEAFLKNKVGYCQQYAAALAWMARVAGVPSRVAFGFTRGQKQGTTYSITNRNAHAWTEVYLNGFGWIPFDATPASGVAGAARTEWAPDTDAPAPSATASGATSAPTANPSGAAAGPQGPDRTDPAGRNGAGGTTTTGMTFGQLLTMIIAALVIVLLLTPAVRRVLVRRRRHHASIPKAVTATSATPGLDVTVTTESVRAREDAHAAWDELIDTMIDYRVPVDPTETPRHTAQRLIRESELTDRPADSATLLGSAEERARYARRPLQGAELPAALSAVRKGVAHAAPRRTRIMATLLPPSVVLRWRLGLGDLSASWVGFLGRLRERTSRWNPRRLLTSRAQ
jgi:transglutaminase-like putative cysteine protease